MNKLTKLLEIYDLKDEKRTGWELRKIETLNRLQIIHGV